MSSQTTLGEGPNTTICTNSHNTTTQPTSQNLFHNQNHPHTQIELQAEHYGDIMPNERPKTIRIALQNLHFLPQHSNHAKSKQLFEYIADAKIDIFLGSEINLNLDKIHQQHLIRERCVKARLNLLSSIAAYNTNEPKTTAVQMGGTLIITTKEATCRTTQKGRDLSNLGQWSWINIQG